jgi:copper resistance protein B
MSAGRVATVTAASVLILASVAAAQTPGGDPNVSTPFGEPVEDRRIFVHGLFDQFEGRIGETNSFKWDGQAWIGTDTNRLWLKSEALVDSSGTVSDGLHQILYSRPVTTYFDAQAGLRLDLDSGPSRVWGAFGIQGLAPGIFGLQVTGFVRDAGHFAAKVEASYDLLLTQRLILQPEIELNFYSKSDRARGIGPGLADMEAALRLRYEITRKVGPYIGVVYGGKFGETATFARRQGESADDVRFVFGLRSWF